MSNDEYQINIEPISEEDENSDQSDRPDTYDSGSGIYRNLHKSLHRKDNI